MADSEMLDEPITLRETIRNIVYLFIASVVMSIGVWKFNNPHLPANVFIPQIAAVGVLLSAVEIYFYLHPGDDEEEEIDDDEEEYPVSCPCAMCRPVNPYAD